MCYIIYEEYAVSSNYWFILPVTISALFNLISQLNVYALFVLFSREIK